MRLDGLAEFESALADFDAAIERAPKWPDPHRLRGAALRQLKRYEEAMEAISRAIELAPKHVNAIYNRAGLHFWLERYEDTLADLERCFELVGGSGGQNARWYQAQALQRLGRDEEALAAMDLAIADSPDLVQSYQRKVLLLFWMGRLDEMKAAVADALEIAPGDSLLHLLTALSRLFPDGRCVESLADLERARELAPHDKELARTVAFTHAFAMHATCPDQYDGELALRLARDAVNENAGTELRQMTLGMALYRHGRLGEAHDALARAVELAVPKPRPDTLFALAMVEQRLNHPLEARRRYDEGVERTRALAWQHHPINRLLQDEAAGLLGIQP
jgi:tetratricopeptide (TPR) repeat protein